MDKNSMMLVLNSNSLDQRSKFCNLQTGRLFTCTVSVSGRGDLVMNYNYIDTVSSQPSSPVKLIQIYLALPLCDSVAWQR